MLVFSAQKKIGVLALRPIAPVLYIGGFTADTIQPSFVLTMVGQHHCLVGDPKEGVILR